MLLPPESQPRYWMSGVYYGASRERVAEAGVKIVEVGHASGVAPVPFLAYVDGDRVINISGESLQRDRQIVLRKYESRDRVIEVLGEPDQIHRVGGMSQQTSLIYLTHKIEVYLYRNRIEHIELGNRVLD